jgi:hypothetical protein
MKGTLMALVLGAGFFSCPHAKAPPGGTPPPAPAVAGGASRGAGSVNLAATWFFAMDANTSDNPTVTMTNTSPSSVSMHSAGTDPSNCGCSAQHAVIHLGATYSCATALLNFDYQVTPGPKGFGDTNTASLRIHFLKAGSRVGWFVGSTTTGHSNCASYFSNNFPTAAIHNGNNTIAIGSLQPSQSGTCNGDFDGLDIRLEGYGCYPDDTSDVTLANMTVQR